MAVPPRFPQPLKNLFRWAQVFSSTEWLFDWILNNRHFLKRCELLNKPGQGNCLTLNQSAIAELMSTCPNSFLLRTVQLHPNCLWKQHVSHAVSWTERREHLGELCVSWHRQDCTRVDSTAWIILGRRRNPGLILFASADVPIRDPSNLTVKHYSLDV